jgi:hypothetical protein
VKSSHIREGVETMKRPIIIVISVIVVFLLLGTIATSMMQFRGTASAPSFVDGDFGYGGGGAPEASMPPVEEPALGQVDLYAFDATKADETTSNVLVQTQERMPTLPSW